MLANANSGEFQLQPFTANTGKEEGFYLIIVFSITSISFSCDLIIFAKLQVTWKIMFATVGEQLPHCYRNTNLFWQHHTFYVIKVKCVFMMVSCSH